MHVKVTSYIPWRQDLHGLFPIVENQTIKDFVETHGIVWDSEALVAVNDKIAHADDVLNNGDQIDLLLPVIGG
ncbi:MoaD/ThiS family protein [Microaerobacter geothermalis]|uniref:MoaD/ThiS family protein n=1 Tax=Microaerobacter geothermalis TaxID=674972 RepID=UPI001F33992B|nr:MoaD/ThiS family protein [Microaerobacter geothermalis]MCF6094920.1 MoaD/ThiS family protein [Microaerobacter geothermalis]